MPDPRQVEDLATRLKGGGHTVDDIARNGNDNGFLIKVAGGGMVNVYDTGKIVVQGKHQEELKAALGLAPPMAAPAKVAERSQAGYGSRKVFVVYGHDTAARTQLEAMLRRWQLEPVILDQLPSEGQTIIEKLEKYTHDEGIRFAVVLATPDDEAYPRGKPDEKRFRARQNVVLELGLLLAKLGRSRVAIFLKDQEHMERPSDIQGLIYLPFKDSVEDSKILLAKEMDSQGLAVDVRHL